MDNEEDVIIQGSVLHNYLKETELSDWISEDVVSTPKKPRQVESHSNKISVSPTKFSNFLKFLKYRIYPVKRLNIMSEIHRRSILSLWMKSDLIYEDDQAFLANYLESTLSDEIDKDNRYRFHKSCSIFVLHLIAFSLCYKLRGNFKKFIHAPIVFFGTSFTSNIFKHFVCWKFDTKLSSEFNLYQTSLQKCLELSNFLKKSIRLTQESEIISRGFTLATIKDAITRIEAGSLETQGNQFLELLPLRKQVFLCSNNLFLKLRNMTESLVQSVPLSQDVDNLSNYLALVPLEHFNLKNDLSEDSIVKTLSVHNLKLIVERYHLQQSEFVTRLILCHFPEFARPIDTELYMSNEDASPITSGLSNLLNYSAGAVTDLSSSYRFHKSLLDGDAIPKQKKDSSIMTDQSDHIVKASIHSIYLHLQATLSRVREFESYLDSCDKSSDSINEKSEESVSLLTSVLKELRSCKDCVEECFSMMSEENVNTDDDDELRVSASIHDVPNKNDQKIIVPCSTEDLIIGDPRIEEEVFEGVVENYEELKAMDYNELTLELNKQKQEVEQATKLYRELKSVLKMRAGQIQEKEDKVLDELKENKMRFDDDRNQVLSEDNDLLPSRIASNEKSSNCENSDINTCENKYNSNILSCTSSFTLPANIAAMAAAKSQSLGLITTGTEEIFGDESSSDEL